MTELERQQPLQITFGAFASFASVAVIQLSSVAVLSYSQLVAICAFAVSIPFLAIIAYCPPPTINPGSGLSRPQKQWGVITLTAPCTAAIGFAAFFWHFDWRIGLAFAVCSVIAYRVLKYWANAKDYRTPNETTQSQ
jgi:hypothetical protein